MDLQWVLQPLVFSVVFYPEVVVLVDNILYLPCKLSWAVEILGKSGEKNVIQFSLHKMGKTLK